MGCGKSWVCFSEHFLILDSKIFASGDFVVARYRATATQKGNYLGIAATNKPVNFQGCNFVELRNGKVIRSRIYADNALLYQQLGVLSLPKAATA
ncbi:MAG: hypothetical protein DMG32_03365 [Acidobacteria bacterium]|nr:MAG: hypothetical protein DMG32_03365 [Acidobacteriota bacterium]